MVLLQRGSNIFQLGEGGGGGSNIAGGVQMLISIETHIIVDSPGGGGGSDPLSPFWIRTWGHEIHKSSAFQLFIFRSHHFILNQ